MVVLHEPRGASSRELETSFEAQKAEYSGENTSRHGGIKRKLDSIEWTNPPSKPMDTRQIRTDKSIELDIQGLTWPEDALVDSVVQFAWAIVLSRYSEWSEISYGVVRTGHWDPVLGVKQLAGHTTSPISLRIVVDEDMTLSALQQQMAPLHQSSLEADQPSSEATGLGWQSRSLLIVDSAEEADMVDTTVLNEYDITLNCQVKKSSVHLRLAFNSTLLSEQLAWRVIDHLDPVLRQICTADKINTKINDLDMVTEQDLRQVWKRNAEVPKTTSGLVHDLIAETVCRFPHKIAVDAWDGELSYAELDNLSTQLAYQLIHMGVRPGTALPLCFEKSMWMPVTQLAVMKAGAASAVIDPNQTKDRITSMLKTIRSELVLCGPTTADMIYRITEREPFVVKEETISNYPEQGDDAGFETLLPAVKPSNLLYVVFTSGTTGNPKGVMITHENFTSAVELQQEYLHFKSTMRLVNFCSYAFDVAWSDVLHTLTVGGCLCIPSEHERKNDFVDFMRRKRVTYIHLTPSVAAILELDTVPTLETVALIGEVVDFDKLPRLRHIKTTIVTYGPAECTVTTTAIVNDGNLAKATIGWACGSTAWIVDPKRDALTPVGLLGELLLEGPLVGGGYLNDSVKTAAAFIEDPSWLLRGNLGVKGRRGRLYRTGDMVRYNDNGELIFLGRKDTQVKINGQRTELGDVEAQVCRVLHSMPEVADVIAEVITPTATQRPTLVAFLLMPKVSVNELKEKAKPVIEMLEKEMSQEGPAHMVPSAFVPMTQLPMTVSGKTDRRALRNLAAEMDLYAFASSNGTGSASHVEPTSEGEYRLRQFWASVLSLPESTISVQDNFLRLGGDSIAAIRLATFVGKEGMSLTVSDIIRHPQLSEMARHLSQNGVIQQKIQPFSLLKSGIQNNDACRQVAESCSVGTFKVEASQIEDIFPCTALQEGLLALTVGGSGKYIGRHLAELKHDVDIVRFQSAWQKVSEKASVLRTHIVNLPGQGLVQVVIQGALQWQRFSSRAEWQVSTNPENRLQEDANENAMGLGLPLSRLALIHEAGKNYFAWTQHHATYDGWSLPLVQKEVEKVYSDQQARPNSLPLQMFVKHVMDQHNEQGKAFWQQQFAGIEASQFPALPQKTYQPKPDKVVDHAICNAHWSTSNVTQASAIRTAWAMLMSWYVDSPDVTFGAVVSGRQAPVLGLEDIAGPTIATIPLRILVRGTLDELLLQVQQQALDMIPYEQYGLQHIRQVSPEASLACDFQSLLLIHPSEEESTDVSPVFENGLIEQDAGPGSENTYAMMLTCQTSDSQLNMQLSFDSVLVKEGTATRLLQQLEHILGQISSLDGSTDVTSLDRVSERDLRDIWKMNEAVPETVDDCVHNIFARTVFNSPDAAAVCAWDGELTYSELDRLSTLLANHLITSDTAVKPGAIVPLYFEKSMWVPVAILAVMKAGAACVALDATLPASRLQSIIDQLSATVILSSKSCAKLAAEITGIPLVEVCENLHNLQLTQPTAKLPTVDPSSPLYIVFTSGSTGAPKGATITHANFCSAIRHHQQELGFDQKSRVFDYTSYAFDVAWSNVLHTLTAGGCLCIPSEDERTADVVGAINRLRATFIHLTPTVGRLLDPAALESVEKVLFIGEALKASDVARWENSSATIYNTYGPAECTVTSTVEIVQPGQDVIGDPGIGYGIGCLAWVVEPHRPERLAAMGTVGELWLEGPIVGAGYLNNLEKTSQAFVENPQWLLDGIAGKVAGRQGRLYKTGDLCYFKPDGTLGFIGRKDTQVKINGQRMELGEVEFHARKLLPEEAVAQVVADVITPDATSSQTLAIFLEMAGKNGEADENTAPMIVDLRKELSKLLPSYMVPSAYIPLKKLPMTATGKTDRRGLRTIGKTYSPPALSSASAVTSDAELTRTESALRDVWAGLLDIKPELISADHIFSELGGDSIKTMSLAMALRQRFNVNIGVPRLIRQRHSLREMAALIDDLLRGQGAEEETKLDLEREINLLTSKMQYSQPATQSAVFLTGSTGFLGTQILRHTLTKRAFDKVVVLVRGVREQTGLDRVIKAAKIAGWWKESFAATIEVWEGDLGAERLGLNESKWNALCGRPSAHGAIDSIIHNGAVVHWATNYDRLKAVNVDSTMQLLQAAMNSPFLKSFVYVSGGLITDSRVWTEEEEKMANGYDQTKYVSERLVSAAATRASKSGTKFTVVKPGQIIGDVYTGIANADDFLWRVVTCATRLGARPVESATSWLSMSDVRHVTETILWHAAGNGTEPFVHIRRGTFVDSFWTAIEEQMQMRLQPVLWDDWIELAKVDMAKERESHPLWPVQQFLGAIGTELVQNDRCEWEMQEVIAATKQNVEYLRHNGFNKQQGRSWTACK